MRVGNSRVKTRGWSRSYPGERRGGGGEVVYHLSEQLKSIVLLFQ